MNSFQSLTCAVLRMNAETGNSFGARGTESSFRPASWKAVSLLLVHLFGRPDQVFPGVLASARAGHNVVQAALVRAQETAGVLAAVTVTLADCASAKLRALLSVRVTRLWKNFISFAAFAG